MTLFDRLRTLAGLETRDQANNVAAVSESPRDKINNWDGESVSDLPLSYIEEKRPYERNSHALAATIPEAYREPVITYEKLPQDGPGEFNKSKEHQILAVDSAGMALISKSINDASFGVTGHKVEALAANQAFEILDTWAQKRDREALERNPEYDPEYEIANWNGQSIKDLPLGLLLEYPFMDPSEAMKNTVPEKYREDVTTNDKTSGGENSLWCLSNSKRIIALDQEGQAILLEYRVQHYTDNEGMSARAMPKEEAFKIMDAHIEDKAQERAEEAKHGRPFEAKSPAEPAHTAQIATAQMLAARGQGR